MRSERINLLVTPEEKGLIDRQARLAGVSSSELIRRAVTAYDADGDVALAEIRALATELGQTAERMEAKLMATLAKVDALQAALADREGMRAAARAELAASGTAWPFGFVEDHKPAGRPT